MKHYDDIGVWLFYSPLEELIIEVRAQYEYAGSKYLIINDGKSYVVTTEGEMTMLRYEFIGEL